MSFHVGQRVVCVDVSGLYDGAYLDGRLIPCDLRQGAIYILRWVGPHNEIISVRLEGVQRNTPLEIFQDEPFRASRFRPVKETDISIFTAMLAPTPKQKQRATASNHQSDASEQKEAVVQ